MFKVGDEVVIRKPRDREGHPSGFVWRSPSMDYLDGKEITIKTWSYKGQCAIEYSDTYHLWGLDVTWLHPTKDILFKESM